MNYIFDIGNVLLTYNPREYLDGMFADETVVDVLLHNIFLGDEWLMRDEGKLTQDEATEIICARIPQYTDEVKAAMGNVNKMFLPIEATINHLPELKKAGHSLYYLSNISFETRDYLVAKYDFFELFNGGVFSCDALLIKPNPEIYRLLLRKYNLNASDCIFYDDMKKNIAAAEKEGIKSVLVTR
ncbi:MAG: HAD family phosphatase [Oscillospiraceae bacterium]|nr:HAD family phosphatase [Oscillospiraceae bacterium]MCL2278945.1 HAD family phosphatase [Oscillospiraceae bacterium]